MKWLFTLTSKIHQQRVLMQHIGLSDQPEAWIPVATDPQVNTIIPKLAGVQAGRLLIAFDETS